MDRERDRPATAGSLDSLPAARPWHAVDAEAVIEAYATTLQGLPETEASARLTILGANRLPEAPPRSAMLRLLLQLHNPLIYVLLGAAALASIIGDIVDALVILGVVLINALIGFIQEGRAEQALKAIQSLIDPRASVIRDGHRITVAADRIVPGDVVLIEAGDRVPADLRLLRARSLRVDESALTGESVPVEKQVAVVADAVPLGERACLAFSGTYVAAGQGTGVAVATGARTELGRISALIRTVRTLRTPLVRQMDRFASQVTLAVLVASVAVLAFAVAMRGYGWAEAFMIVVGIAVAAIPEGLPAIMTITLAVGVQRMARRNAIIRQLPAVETLGSVSVICSDKTGTLTGNEMTVRAVATTAGLTEVSGAGYRPIGEFRRGGCDVEPADDALLQELARAAALCNDAALRNEGGAWVVDGDPMEGALLSLAVKATLDPEALSKTLPRDDEIPFDAAHRFMATLHHSHGQGSFVVVKGAPERVLAMCATERTADGGARPLAGAVWLAQLDTLALGGHRVLAFATKPAPADKRSLRFDDASNGFTMLGLVGLIDPPRPEAIKAVAECKAAGISVRMITGDHGATAGAIARQIGLGEHARIVTGADLDAVDAESLRTIAKEACVFARTSPEHKLRLVEALQADGAVVAMTGDGVNDAPALKRADVGVAMGGKGTEAAKQAAEMVLADDNFASIVAAVRE
ncbi:MAG: HAD-IC family P-type ATPase, partial [Alphaproteobacteria bacterium]|nr:HAD-IC family P-type ATPase [Alphaproteobacteria bacterium]